MPGISPVSAADLSAAPEIEAPAKPRAPKGRPPSYPGLAGALAREAADAARRKAHELVFARSAYRLSLVGRVPERPAVIPDALFTGTLEGAQDILRGRFALPSGAIEVKTASPFDLKSEPAAAAELHRFEWLAHLEKAGGKTAAYVGKALIEDWLDRYQNFEAFCWRGDVLGPRLVAWAAHSRFLNGDNDLVFRSRLMKAMAEQTRHLARIIVLVPVGLPRLEAAAALLTMQAVWRSEGGSFDKAADLLRTAVSEAILPDGGVVSRSPRQQVLALAALTRTARALGDAGLPLPTFLPDVLTPMRAALAMLRHGDGRLGLFNGGSEGDTALIAELIDDAPLDTPSAFAPDWRYGRLAAGRSVVLFDGGGPPAGALASEAHAAPLSFEFSHADEHLVVNGGTARTRGAAWIDAARRTAAHATLQIGEEDAGAILTGRSAQALGPLLYGGASTATVDAAEEGLWADGSHGLYQPRFAVTHRRRIFLDGAGADLRGEDTLTRGFGKSQGALDVAIRFPLHPDVRAALDQAGDSVMLAPPNGPAWRFRAAPLGPSATLALEPAAYMGGPVVRRSQAIVVRAVASGESWTMRWAFKMEGPPSRARRRFV